MTGRRSLTLEPYWSYQIDEKLDAGNTEKAVEIAAPGDAAGSNVSAGDS